MNHSSSVALVLGGYVNGYSIIRELHASGVREIWLFDDGASISRHSRRIRGAVTVGRSADDLLAALQVLRQQYEYIVPFPTDDERLEQLAELADQIESFCFIPCNQQNIKSDIEKPRQYEACAVLGVPYPRTAIISAPADLDKIFKLRFPLILKPVKRHDVRGMGPRNILLHNYEQARSLSKDLRGYLDAGLALMASEIVPGDDDQIFAYVAYRSRSGKILNEWSGRKLSQYPQGFGVFASASNEASDLVEELGRKLVVGMDLYGIVEPEFKYDPTDAKFKLMEINLRSMMWNRVGFLSGVRLHFTQWQDATEGEIPEYRQESKSRNLVFMKHELGNLLSSASHVRTLRSILLGGRRVDFAIFDAFDPGPWLWDCWTLLKGLARRCLRRLSRR